MSDLERARAAANAALLSLTQEIGFAIYRVATSKEADDMWCPPLAAQANATDEAIAAFVTALAAEQAQRANIRAAADRIAEAAEAQLRG